MKRWALLLSAGMALLLLTGNIGGTRASFTDIETSSGNSLTAWTSELWAQTSQADFEGGVLNNVEVISPGDAILELVPEPSLVASDNSEVSVAGDQEWRLVKGLTFTKSGATYNQLLVVSNLKADHKNFEVYSSIRVNGEEKASHSTTSTTYESYEDYIDLSGYPDGKYSLELYLKVSHHQKPAYNSLFELYRTHTYASSGTIASQVLDTGSAGARWDGLFWDETLPPGTAVTFEVRASDEWFAKDADGPQWVSLGGTSPVTSGLLSGRYMQWRARLTPDTSYATTPVLHEVRVYYH